jgi:subtilisin-like proprotein convertase family protein
MKKLNSNHKTIATAQPTGRGIKRLTMAVLLLLVSHWVTAQTTFTNSSSISCGSAFGGATNGSPYPSNITVSGMTGVISNVTVTLTNVTHTNPDDIDIVVQSPTGVNVILMSDVGGSGDITNRTYTLSMAASNFLSDGSSNAAGTYKPTNSGASDNWPSPGPGNLTQSTPTLADFNGAAANGVWKLYVRDDATFSGGSISGGWSVTITTCTPPSATASNDGPSCVGSPINFTATGGTSYAWTGPDGFSSSSATPTIASATLAKAGLYTVTVTDAGCSSTASTTVVVNDAPSGTPTASPVSVCEGADVTLSANHFAKATTSNTTDFPIPDNNPTGITSTITVSGTGATASQLVSSVLINITHTYNADLDIFLKAPNGSQIELSTDNGSSGNNYTNTLFQTGGGNITSASAPMTGTFAPEQAFSTLTGTGDGTWSLVIIDDAADDLGTLTDWTLTYNTISGVSYSWTSTPSGFTSSVANPVANPTSNTTYEVIATAGGCSSAPATVTVTTLVPPVAVASSNTPVCEGSDLNLNASGGTGYAWTGPSFTSTDQNPTISGATLAASGNYTVVVTNAFGCTDAETISVTVNDKPELSILTQDNVTCNGGSDGAIALDITGGTGPFLYFDGSNFSFDGTFSGYVAGPVSVTVTDDNSCEDVISFNITEPGPISIADAGSDQLLCSAGTANVSGNTPVVGVGTWTVESGTALITSPSSSSTGLTGMASGTIVLRYTIEQVGCGSNFDEVTLINSAAPPAQPGVVTGVTVACPPLSGETFSIDPVADATSYLWYTGPGTNGVSFNTATNGTSVNANFAATANSGYTLRVHAINGCGAGNYNSIFVRRTVSTPAMTGVAQACASSTQTYTIPTAVAGAVSYIWTGPAGSTIDGNPTPFTTTNLSVNIQFSPSFVTGNVCVRAVGPCGIETANRCISVTSIPARPLRVDGGNTACPGTTKSFSVPAVAGATSYNWVLPANASIVSGAGTSNVDIAFTNAYSGGNICVSATNACTTGQSICLNVQKATPSMPRNITGPVGGICGTSQTYSVPFDAGTISYNWTVPSGAVITSGAGTNTIAVDFTGVTFPSSANQYLQIGVTRTNSCSTGAVRTLNIKGVPENALNITGPAGVCSEESGVTFSVPPVFGANNYTWTVPSGAVIIAGQGTNSIVVDWGINPGVVSVSASNACGSGGSRTKAIAINCRVAGISNNGFEVSALPNPASENVNISFNSNSAGTYSLELMDLSGRIIANEKGSSVEGMNQIQMNLRQVAKGAYIVKLVSNQQSGLIRLIVE